MSLYIASFDQLMTSSARSFSKGEGCFHNMSEKKPIIPPFEKVGLGGFINITTCFINDFP
jgi:hypothetical protein